MTAPINSGNSGGPVIRVNLKDKQNPVFDIVGISVAKIQNSEGMGFAVPINAFTCVDNLYLERKIIFKPQLFIQFNNITQEYKDYLKTEMVIGSSINIDDFEGIVINYIRKESPFYQKLEIGDILLEWQGTKIKQSGQVYYDNIESFIDLNYLLNTYRENSKINFKYFSRSQCIINEDNINLEYKEKEKIKQLVNPLEKIDYIIVDGYVLVQLKRNHFDMILNSDNIDWEQTIELIK